MHVGKAESIHKHCASLIKIKKPSGECRKMGRRYLSEGTPRMDAPNTDRLGILSTSATFHDLPPEILDRLAQGMTESVAKRGTQVFRRGTPATGIHLLSADM